jgi:hypothetical protein
VVPKREIFPEPLGNRENSEDYKEDEKYLELKRGKKDIKIITDCPHVDRKHYAKV